MDQSQPPAAPVRPRRFVIIGIIALVIAALGAGGVYAYRMMNAVNPDPNHTHADLAVWVNGMKLDLSDRRYMSGIPSDPENPAPETALHQHFHLHDNNGTVVHRHKPGLPIADFFASIGLPMQGECMTLDQLQYSKLDAGWKSDFNIQRELCSSGKFRWTMIVNGATVPYNPGYIFSDNDKILLSYGASDTAAQEEYARMTDNACLYSKTCPWRGEPPTENCIADPEVPCIE